MASKQSDLGSLGVDSSTEQAGGLRPSDLIDLPESQQKIAQWMLNQPECTLTEVAANTDMDEGDALIALYQLMQQSFVQQIEVEGETRYRLRLASREGSKRISQTIQQILAPGKPLAVIPNPSGTHTVMAGSSFELCVTVSNKGNQSALIDIYIDEVSQLLRQWCDSPYERIALSPNSTSEVVFQFQVPPQTLPGNYTYLLVVDAPQHYPEDTPIRYSQRLQILPAIEDVVRDNDATFTVSPASSSRGPIAIQPGQLLQVSVLVDNRSNRVDRFWLSCSDLEDSWWGVRYPEGLQLPGLVTTGDGLDLNPGAKGEILLFLNPPLNAVAGNYFATLRLQSANNPDFVLLDVVYLQILPVYLLNVELRTLLGRVRRLPGVFEVRLTNDGNTARELVVYATSLDEEELCTYTLEPTQVRVLPRSDANVALQVKPTKWWCRPLYGRGRIINFAVGLEDPQQLPLPKDLPQGTLVWEARPWWQFLLLLLTGLCTLGAIAFLIWWLFFRPPAPPKIIGFSSDNSAYKEADEDFIRLNWEIRNPRQIQSLLVTAQPSNGAASVQPMSYDFSKGIPDGLKNFCIIRAELVCKNVRTEARKAGDYVFELKVFSKRAKDVAADSSKTDIVKVQPLDPSKIQEFSSTKPVYQEASILKPLPDVKSQKSGTTPTIEDSILLNWKIIKPDQIKELKLIGRAPDGSVNSELKRYDFSQGIPQQLKDFCQLEEELTCKNVPTEARKPGDYVFELTVVPQKESGEPSISAKTDTIKIQPNLVPLKIVYLKVNGQDAPTKYLVPINPDKPIKVVSLSWQVEGGKDLKVELLPAPGTVPSVGAISYPLSQQPSSQTLTLKATNAAAQEITKSVTLETLNPTPVPSSTPPVVLPKLPVPRPAISPPKPSVSPSASTVPSPVPKAAVASPSPSPSASPSPVLGSSSSPSPGTSPSPGSSPSPSLKGSPSLSDPDSLSPFELPPRFD